MPSFDAINYSLRPSKSIQRQIIFDGIDRLRRSLGLRDQLYVGFGSIWFTDFVLAHRLLGIDAMISIEGHEVGFRRAVFNAPFATVRVEHGMAGEVLPVLLEEAPLRNRPWIVWLDYDYELKEGMCDDIRLVVEYAPHNSILLVTFNGLERKYGTPPQRPQRLAEILGAVVPDDLEKDQCKDDAMHQTLADLALDYLKATATSMARPGGFVPAFRVVYRDNAPMITVGGILPSPGAAGLARDETSSLSWPSMPIKPIKAPHLTMKEAAVLQSKMPREDQITRAQIQELGFDLEEDQIEIYQSFYRQYPSFAQIMS